MSKKSQTNARRNNTQAGRSVINFYNNGTVNMDARQNRSCNYKTENNGCTFNYPLHSAKNMVGDYYRFTDHIVPEEPSNVVEISTSEKLQSKKSRFRSLICAVSAVIAIAAGCAFCKSNH